MTNQKVAALKNKILLVDDEIVTLKLLANYLTDGGFKVKTALDGIDALNKLNDYLPDLILSDVVMPNMDGYEFLEKLKYKPALEGIPFVFLSAKTDAVDQLKGFREGANEYICKPVVKEEFVQRIKEIIQKASLKTQSSLTKADLTAKISDTAIEDLMQLFEFSMKSGKVVFQNPAGRELGVIYFDSGSLVYAQKDSLLGEEAFYEMMGLRQGIIAFYNTPLDVSENIEKSTKSLLLNVALMKDESENLERLLPDLDLQLTLNTSRIPQKVIEKFGSKNLVTVMTHILNRNTVKEIVQSPEMSSLRAGSIIANLLEEKIVGHTAELSEKANHNDKKIFKAG